MTGSVWVDATLFGILGLLIGSFLNVVIHRLPRMMQQEWKEECAAYAREQGLVAEANNGEAAAPRYNLLVPRSQCPHCQHLIRWYENIPVLSYLALRGRCANCHAPISLRYPLVELACGLLFFFCAVRWGWSASALAWCAFSAVLLAAACIDWDTTLLPDDLTLPLLWAGLLAAVARYTSVSVTDAVLGAAFGYLSLWCVYWGFKLATGKEGMGYGDFKLLAALGAWLGWKMLAVIVLLSSLVGAVVGIALIVFARRGRNIPIPFGPYLAAAGLLTLFFGKPIVAMYLGSL